MNKPLKVLLLSAGAFLVSTVTSRAGFNVGNFVYKTLRRLDPGNTWLVNSVHHVFQAALAFLLVFLFAQGRHIPLSRFAFRKEGFKTALKPVLVAVLIWTLIQFSFSYLHIYILKLEFSLPYIITPFNVLSYLAFQVFLSGTSEEILFRALIMLGIYELLNDFTDKRRSLVSAAIATAVFMAGHINIRFYPFEIIHFNPAQQATCLIFGLFYAWLVLRYRNIYAAMLAHNLLNGVISIVSYLLFVSYPLHG